MLQQAWLEKLLADLGLESLSRIVEVWMLQVFILVFLTAVINYIFKVLIKRLEKKTFATRTPWDDALIFSVMKPLSILIWIIGLSFAATIINGVVEHDISDLIVTIRELGVLICILWFLVRFVSKFEHYYIEQKILKSQKYDKSTIVAISKLLRLALYITGALIILQALGFSVSGVLAFGGVGGIAIGFAAKDLLANFFGGLMIYLDRPFSVGDWIRSPDKKIEGTVENIGWRLTRIRTFEKRPIYVPNSLFTNIVVENPSRMNNRRIYETIGIRYTDIAKMPEIVAAVKSMLMAHKEIDHNQTIIVNFNTFNDSSLDFFIYAYTNTVDWVKYHQVKQDVLLQVATLIEQHQAEIAFPTRSLFIENGVEKAEADHAAS